ncbi:hypothetical protein [Gluconobacter kondonii]|uniref:hypothetical protein n=1 Tax=Gluconobacter kondonii TaxID=941463 RepID=UPI001B8D4903|nr:hypothetical protein [Gluconobacter kondonii]MBS1083955.1 hypothetical protein [Gluconobacter kondonii]
MPFKPSRLGGRHFALPASRSRARTKDKPIPGALLRTHDASTEAALNSPKDGLPPVTGNKVTGLVLKKQQDRAEEISSPVRNYSDEDDALKEAIRRKEEADAHRLQEMIRRNKEYWNK